MRTIKKCLATLLLLTIALTVSAQEMSKEEVEKTLQDYVEEVNAKCPVNDGNGFILVMGFEDNQMNIAYGVDAEKYEQIGTHPDVAKADYLEKAMKDEEKLGMMALLHMVDATLSVIYFNADTQDKEHFHTLVFTSEELEEALSPQTEE